LVLEEDNWFLTQPFTGDEVNRLMQDLLKERLALMGLERNFYPKL